MQGSEAPKAQEITMCERKIKKLALLRRENNRRINTKQ